MRNKKTVLRQLNKCYKAQCNLESELGKLSVLFSEKSGIEELEFVAQYVYGDGVLISPIDVSVDMTLGVSDLTVIRPESLIETLPINNISELTGSI